MDPEQLSPEQRAQLEEKLKNMSPEEIAELQRQQCIFCQIIDGKIPSKKVYEDEKSLAFLDIRPATKGHVLIIPKMHFSILPQMPKEELGHLFLVAKSLSKIILKSLRAKGTNIFIANGAAAGQRAPHVMMHIIPRNTGDGLFELDKKPIETELQQKVKAALTPQFRKIMGLPPQETQETLTDSTKDSQESVESEVSEEPEEVSESDEAEVESTEPQSLEEQLGGSSNDDDDEDDDNESPEEDLEETDDDEVEDNGEVDDSNEEIEDEPEVDDDSESEQDESSEEDDHDEETQEELDETNVGEEDSSEEKEEGVSLDDIANLFK